MRTLAVGHAWCLILPLVQRDLILVTINYAVMITVVPLIRNQTKGRMIIMICDQLNDYKFKCSAVELAANLAAICRGWK